MLLKGYAYIFGKLGLYAAFVVLAYFPPFFPLRFFFVGQDDLYWRYLATAKISATYNYLLLISSMFAGTASLILDPGFGYDVFNIPGIEKSMERFEDLLGQIEKALGEYLERERFSFPRYCTVSCKLKDLVKCMLLKGYAYILGVVLA